MHTLHPHLDPLPINVESDTPGPGYMEPLKKRKPGLPRVAQGPLREQLASPVCCNGEGPLAVGVRATKGF